MAAMSDTPLDPDFEALLEFVKATRGFDFTGYKRSTLTRRVAKRMQTARITSFKEYQAYLETQPDEYAELFNTILINVTAFFRDPEAWEALRNTVLPELLAARSDDEPLRAWSAGCAS